MSRSLDEAKEQLYSWMSDPSKPIDALPKDALVHLVTPDAPTRQTDTELEWLRTRSTQGNKPDANESARLLALLTPLIVNQRMALSAWRTCELNSARVVRDGGQLADKMTAFRAALDERQIAPIALSQLAQLEWARFLVLVHQVPQALPGLDMTTMHHINDFVERVKEPQLDALVAALPADEVQYFCTEQATPAALHRLLHSLLRQVLPTNDNDRAPPCTSLVDFVVRIGTQRNVTDHMRTHVMMMLEQARDTRSLRNLLGRDGKTDVMAERMDVLIEFVQRQLLPALSRATHVLSGTQTDLARLVVTHMPNEQLPE